MQRQQHNNKQNKTSRIKLQIYTSISSSDWQVFQGCFKGVLVSPRESKRKEKFISIRKEERIIGKQEG